MNRILCALVFMVAIFIRINASYTYVYPKDVPNPKEVSDEFISDPAGYLTAEESAEINGLIKEIRDAKGFEVAVVVLYSINYQPALAFATDLGNLWKVGKGNRGIILLVVVGDREMAIATGYETEIYLPDLLTKEISEQEIIPYFKTENYGKGVLEGVRTIRNILMEENVPAYVAPLMAEEKAKSQWKMIALGAVFILMTFAFMANPTVQTVFRNGAVLTIALIVASVYEVIQADGAARMKNILVLFSWLSFLAISVNTFLIVKKESKSILIHFFVSLFVMGTLVYGLHIYGLAEFVVIYMFVTGIVFGLFVLIYLATFLEKDPYHKYHTIKFFQLDIFAYLFPFPMYAVDLLVDKQLDAWRNRVRFSPKTGLEMRKLCEKEDDKYLESGQITEEQIKSVDYDVWISDEPEDVLILDYKKWFSKYSSCDKCKYKTWYLVYDKTITAATYSSSGTGETKKECVHCKHAVISRYTIPKKEKSSSSGGGGSSSSGSSSGGSWGGGSFGGGGSSSRW
jgi:uncharacterized protein